MKNTVKKSEFIAAMSIVFGADLVRTIDKRLNAIGPNTDRVTCGDIIEATASFENDAATRRVCLDRMLAYFPHLSIRKGRDGGIVHKDEPRTIAAPIAGKAVHAALQALSAAGVNMTPEMLRAAIGAAKASRKHEKSVQ